MLQAVSVSQLAVNYNSTVGAILLGNIAAAISYGITCLQTYQYLSGKRDGKLMRGLITFLWIVDSSHLVFITVFVYHYAVANFGNIPALLELTWSGHAHLVATSVSDIIVRSIFAYRVITFVKSKVLAAILATLALTSFAGGLVFAIESAHYGSLSKLHTLLWVMDMAYGAAVAADLILTISLCVSLAQHRRHSLAGTGRVIRMLMRYTVNTGALVGMCTIAEMVAFATMPDNFIYQGIYFVLPTLYLNALLATLNARDQLREYSMTGGLAVPSAGNRGSVQSQPSMIGFRPARPMIQVKVDTIYEVHSDAGGDIQPSAEKLQV